MNKNSSIIYSILISAILFPGCRENGNGGSKNNPSANSVLRGEKYTIDKKESVVTWKGSMLIGPSHAGYVYVYNGELMIEKDQLVNGVVKIDMTSIEYADKEEKNSPVHHLKSPDYFDVERFPVSSFTITEVESVTGGNMKVTGNLTIRGVTNPVTFPATMEVKDGIARANGKVVIDRTLWGIRYRSGKFYDNLADQAVSDDIEFEMKIVARK